MLEESRGNPPAESQNGEMEAEFLSESSGDSFPTQTKHRLGMCAESLGVVTLES